MPEPALDEEQVSPTNTIYCATIEYKDGRFFSAGKNTSVSVGLIPELINERRVIGGSTEAESKIGRDERNSLTNN